MLTVWRTSHRAAPVLVRPESQEEPHDKESNEPAAESAYVGGPMDLDFVENAAGAIGNVVLPSGKTVRAEERRSRTRAKVNFSACVRSDWFAEEIARCIDMARGGVGFKSKNPHEKGTMIDIAVPFSPEERSAPAIFVKARVANVRKLEAEGMWRVGVEFVR
jgi:hypothetical protein